MFAKYFLAVALFLAPLSAYAENECQTTEQVVEVGKSMPDTAVVKIDDAKVADELFKKLLAMMGEPEDYDASAAVVVARNTGMADVIFFKEGCTATVVRVPVPILIKLMPEA